MFFGIGIILLIVCLVGVDEFILVLSGVGVGGFCIVVLLLLLNEFVC